MCGLENGVSPVSTMYFLKIFPFSTLCSPPNGIQSYSWFGIPEWPLWHPSVPMRAIYFSVRYFSFSSFSLTSFQWDEALCFFEDGKKKLMKFPFRHIISSSLKQSHVTSHMSIVSSSSAMQCWFTDTMASHLTSFKISLSTWSLRKQLELRIKKTKRNKTQYSSSLTRSSRHLAEHPASSESQQILG